MKKSEAQSQQFVDLDPVLLDTILRSIRDSLNDPVAELVYSKKTFNRLDSIYKKFSSELDAAYQSKEVDTWSFRMNGMRFLWLISIAIVVSSDREANKWLRYLVSEKIPKQQSYLSLRLFVRTCNWRLVPQNYLSDQVILSLIGNYRKQIEHSITKIRYFKQTQTSKRFSHPRGYTDGVGNLNLTWDKNLASKEFEKDYSSTEIQQEYDRLKNTIKEAESLLVQELDEGSSF